MSSTVKCNRPAVTAATWETGERLVLCGICCLNMRASNMGCPLTLDTLRPGETHCTQNVRPEKAEPTPPSEGASQP